MLDLILASNGLRFLNTRYWPCAPYAFPRPFYWAVLPWGESIYVLTPCTGSQFSNYLVSPIKFFMTRTVTVLKLFYCFSARIQQHRYVRPSLDGQFCCLPLQHLQNITGTNHLLWRNFLQKQTWLRWFFPIIFCWGQWESKLKIWCWDSVTRYLDTVTYVPYLPNFKHPAELFGWGNSP